MKKIIFILLILLIATPAAFSQDVFLPFLKVFSWISCDSLYTRAAVINSTLTLSGSVSGNFIADTVEANEKIYLNKTVTDQEDPTFSISGDADSDSGATTTETLSLSLTGNATPTSAWWHWTTTQSKGWQFNGTVQVEGANIQCSSTNRGVANTAGNGHFSSLDNTYITSDYAGTGSDNFIAFTTDGLHTGGTELVRIDDGGEVGIGTASPVSNSLTLGTKGAQRDLIVTRANTPAASGDSCLIATVDDGNGKLDLKAGDADSLVLYTDNSTAYIKSNNSISLNNKLLGWASRIFIDSTQLVIMDATDADTFSISDNGTNTVFDMDNPILLNNTLFSWASKIYIDSTGIYGMDATDADTFSISDNGTNSILDSDNPWLIDGAGGSNKGLLIDGNKTSGNLLEITNNNDGTYVADDSSFAIEDDGRISVCGILQQHVVVTDAAGYTVLAVNSGKVHLIADLTQNTTIDLPAEAAGLNYEFWYIGAATETHDHTIDSENNDNYFTGGIVHHDTDDGTLAAVYSNGSSNSILTLTNIAGGTIIKVSCDGTDWSITGTVISDTAPAFSDQP